MNSNLNSLPVCISVVQEAQVRRLTIVCAQIVVNSIAIWGVVDVCTYSNVRATRKCPSSVPRRSIWPPRSTRLKVLHHRPALGIVLELLSEPLPSVVRLIDSIGFEEFLAIAATNPGSTFTAGDAAPVASTTTRRKNQSPRWTERGPGGSDGSRYSMKSMSLPPCCICSRCAVGCEDTCVSPSSPLP